MFSFCAQRKGLLKVTIVRDRLRVLSVWLFVMSFGSCGKIFVVDFAEF